VTNTRRVVQSRSSPAFSSREIRSFDLTSGHVWQLDTELAMLAQCDVQLHHRLFQQLQRPPRAPLGRFGTGQSDQLGFSGSIDDARPSRGWRTLAGQGWLQPSLQQLPARPRRGVDAGVQSRSNLAVTPGIAGIGCVRLQQMRAFSNCRAGRLPVCISSVPSHSRSSALSFTINFFTADCFAVTMHLQHGWTHRFRQHIARRFGCAVALPHLKCSPASVCCLT
jgi:hypothetical protein